MKGIHVHIRGFLDTDPNGDWCGARPHCEKMAGDIGLELRSMNQDDPALMKAIDGYRAEGFQFISGSGHSFGGQKVHELFDQYFARSLDCLAEIDRCPPLEPLGWKKPAREFSRAPRYGYACWQHNSAPTGIMLLPRTNVVVEDCTNWTLPRLGHIDFLHDDPTKTLRSIAGDSRVWFGIDGRPGIYQQVAAAWASRQ